MQFKFITYQIYSHNLDHRQIIAPDSEDQQYYTNLDFSPQFKIKVFKERQPNTMRLSIGIAGLNQSNALRFMVNHVWGKENDPNFYENPNNKMTRHGWTDYGEFYAFKEYQQGTTLMKAFEFSNPHRLILTCNETEIKAYENLQDANLVEQFYAYYIPKEMNVDIYNDCYQEEIIQLELVTLLCDDIQDVIKNKICTYFPEIKAITQQIEDVKELTLDTICNLELLSDQTFIKTNNKLQQIQRILVFIEQCILPIKNLKNQTLVKNQQSILKELISQQKFLIEEADQNIKQKLKKQMIPQLEQSKIQLNKDQLDRIKQLDLKNQDQNEENEVQELINNKEEVQQQEEDEDQYEIV